MTVLYETLHPGAFITSEHNMLSRDQVTIAAEQTILVGQVLGCTGNLTDMSASSAAAASNTGNGALTFAGTPLLDSALDGIYEIVMTGAGATAPFDVFGPTGLFVGKGAVATAFAGPIAFTIAAGGTAFAIGDSFQVAVLRPAISGEIFYPLNASATDGTQNARAIAVYPIPTASASVTPLAAITRDAEVRSANLTWPSGATAGQIAEWTNQLAKYDIIIRPSTN